MPAKKTAKKAAKTTPKPGRPKGAKTKRLNYKPVLNEPARCRACGSTQLGTLRSNTRQLKGQRGDRRHTAITWRICQCADCGALTNVKIYKYRPQDWPAANRHKPEA